MKIFLVLFGTISSFNMVSSQKIPRLQPIDCTIISEVQSKVSEQKIHISRNTAIEIREGIEEQSAFENQVFRIF